MAVGGVISSRTFGSLISGSGKVYEPEQAIAHKGEHLGGANANCSRGASFIKALRTPRHNYSYMSRTSFSPILHRGFLSSERCTTQNTELEHPLTNHRRINEKFQSTNLKRSVQGRCECFLSSVAFGSSWVQPAKLNKLGISDAQRTEPRRTTTSRADYKSESLDITGSNFESTESPDVQDEIISAEEDVQKLSSWQEQFPKRWVIVLLCFSAFLLCNMDRVNMSIAILPMAAEFNWNSATVGLIQSSFFWGYLLTQIVGGIWADKVGGKLVLGFGVIWWSLATVLTPIAAKAGLPFLLAMRAFMGIGEGVAMPAMNNMLSKWIPVSERSRSLALVYSGMYLGSVTGLAFSPVLIHKFGWPSVFYSFGSLGSIWFLMWLRKAHSTPQEDPELSAEEKKLILGGSVSKAPVSSIPWKLILSKAPVWALIISHFCHNWGTFILLTWMPTYYNQVLKFNLAESGLFCVLPWLTMAVFANIGGWIADTLVSKGFSITTVRKVIDKIVKAHVWSISNTQVKLIDFYLVRVTCMHFEYMSIEGCNLFWGLISPTSCPPITTSFNVTDHAIDWVSRSSFLSHTAQSCTHTSPSSPMHVMQSGLGCVFTVGSLFQPPRYWPTICWSTTGIIKHCWGACRCLWYSRHRIHSPTRFMGRCLQGGRSVVSRGHISMEPLCNWRKSY